MNLLALLRPRRAPALVAPLQAAEWSGHALRLRCSAPPTAPLAIDVDGVFFTEVRADAQGHVDVPFAFAPSGHDAMSLLPRLGRDGVALAARAFDVQFGVAGFAAESAASPVPLAPLRDASACVPFGVDCAGFDVAVVVPVYNAAVLVERCLDAVLLQTGGRTRLIVIDDASPDADIAPLLARYDGLARVSVLRNAGNRGFTATANRGIDAAGGADVVLLNADAEVGPDWLANLRRAALSRSDVATVTAVSDNAGAFSVPELEQANPLPPAWTFVDSARALNQRAGLAYPALPTGNGFCLYIRRSVIDACGKLDESAFPQGYGEENDFCQRASKAGWRHLVAGNVLVRHARSMSFGDERRAALGRAGMAVLRQRYPDYEADVGASLFSFERRALDWRVRRTFAAASSTTAPRRRLLWVGNEPAHWPDAERWLLRANGARNELVCEGAVVIANTWKASDAEASYRALWDWLQLYAIEGLLVAETKQSAAEILCGLLGIPILVVDVSTPASVQASLQLADTAARSFEGRSS